MYNFIIASKESHEIRILIPTLLVRKLKPIVLSNVFKVKWLVTGLTGTQVDLTAESMLLLHHVGVGTWKEAEGLM